MSASDLRLRPAAPDDAERTLAWRNRPEIVALGTQQRRVDAAEHAAWFAEALASDDRLLLIVEADGEPIGQVRFDALDGVNWSVSIYLLEPYTGRGLGTRALRLAWEIARDHGVERAWAFVRADNARSAAAFRRAGFAPALEPGVAVPARHHALCLEAAVSRA